MYVCMYVCMYVGNNGTRLKRPYLLRYRDQIEQRKIM